MRLFLLGCKLFIVAVFVGPIIYVVLTDNSPPRTPRQPETLGQSFQEVAGHTAGHLVKPALIALAAVFTFVVGLIFSGLRLAARGTQTLGQRIASGLRGDPSGRGLA
jgi:hypothetical protein